jgi:hypothetical protein
MSQVHMSQVHMSQVHTSQAQINFTNNDLYAMLVYLIGICIIWLEALSIGLQKLTQILRLLHQLTCVHASLVLLAMYDSYGTKVQCTDLGTIQYESLSGTLKNATLV